MPGASSGIVYLVGAGPGDPGLLTLRGQHCLKVADLVLYDGLVSPLLLRHTKATCERTARAAGPGGKRLDQKEINARLIDAARAGKRVVRLKGGDPFLFGRGSEEAAALAAAGVPFEVVPGVTAAIAAAAYAGLSLTHREHASAVAFVTGHEDPAKPDTTLDYAALARFPGTLVFYMGLHRIGAIATALLESGKAPSTPTCVVSHATTPHQRSVEGPLAEIAALVQNAELHAPSLIVIGDCVRQRREIAWFERKPLLGRRIGVTRPEHQADESVERLLALGAEPVLMPLLEIHEPDDWSPVDAAIDQLEEFHWLIFTSVNGVVGFLNRLWFRDLDLRRLGKVRLAVIGPATAAKLAEYRLKPDIVPTEYRAEGLVKVLAPHVAGARILWAGADRGRDVLLEGLSAAGAEVQKITTYRSCDVVTLPPNVTNLLSCGELHWVALSSPSIAQRFATLLPEEARQHLGTRIRLAAISPVTSAAAREAGLPIAAEASEYTWPGLLEAILQAEGTASKE